MSRTMFYWPRYMRELSQEADLPPPAQLLFDVHLYTGALVALFGFHKTRTVRFSFAEGGESFTTSPHYWRATLLYWILKLLGRVGYMAT